MASQSRNCFETQPHQVAVILAVLSIFWNVADFLAFFAYDFPGVPDGIEYAFAAVAAMLAVLCVWFLVGVAQVTALLAGADRVEKARRCSTLFLLLRRAGRRCCHRGHRADDLRRQLLQCLVCLGPRGLAMQHPAPPHHPDLPLRHGHGLCLLGKPFLLF